MVEEVWEILRNLAREEQRSPTRLAHYAFFELPMFTRELSGMLCSRIPGDFASAKGLC